jgi:putative phosphoesterase
VGELEILTELEAIAPVTAVWGNTDDWEVRGKVPEVAEVEVGGLKIGMMHGHQLGSPTPASVAGRLPEAGLVVFGHTHVPVTERVGRVLAINPGSVGPRRFHLPVSLAIATVENGEVTARQITFDV